MTFAQAKATVMPFGKYRGRTVGSMLKKDDELLYLDWMVGLDDLYGDIKEALGIVLSDATIGAELERLVEERKNRALRRG